MNNEFSQIISGLKKSINDKTQKLQSNDGFNSHSQGEINNITGRVSSLEEAASDIVQNYNGNQNMLINFKKRANEIKVEIEELSCK